MIRSWVLGNEAHENRNGVLLFKLLCVKIIVGLYFKKGNDKMNDVYLSHHGILGMKWGIRRYQNKDGTLTKEGRKRLGLDKYDRDHNSDTILKKGTKASRVINTNRYEDFKNPKFGGSDKAAKKYIDNVLTKENEYERKYISVDGVKNSGRTNGKEYYMSWFTNEGLDPDMAHMSMYELKKNARVASGKKVVDALIDDVGSQRITELLKRNESIKSLTLDYTRDKDLFNRVNERFIKKGYDAIEDINDLDTDMPVIMFNSSKNLGKPISTQSGKEALEDIYKKYRNK